MFNILKLQRLDSKNQASGIQDGLMMSTVSGICPTGCAEFNTFEME